MTPGKCTLPIGDSGDIGKPYIKTDACDGYFLEVPDVHSSISTDEINLWYTTPALPHETTDVVLSCFWQDQGWGNQKGRLASRLVGSNDWVDITPLAPHQKTRLKIAIPLQVFVVKDEKVSHPLKLEFGFKVGHGGGHSLHVTEGTLSFGLLCCVCALDLGHKRSMCEGCNQSWTHLKALENKVFAVTMGSELLQEFTSTRALVGMSLQYRLDLIVVNKLLQTSEGVDTLVRLMHNEGLQGEVQLECHSIKIVNEDGNLDLSVSEPAREAARREKEKGLPVKLSRSVIPAHLRMRSVSKAEGLAALVPNGKLKTLNVSHNKNLKLLPVEELMEMECLTSIECRGCSRLHCPPPEIAELKGDEVVRYLKSALVKHGGMLNTAVEMIAIGNGESGKTSIIRALMHGTSEKIHEDKRTVGIDLKTWKLSEEDLVFHIKDLAGQAVYSLTNQFFFVQRAIYLLVWRVDKGKSSDTESWEKKISDMVLTWMESLQLRVPGASLLLVVTHIDLVSQEELKRRIEFVQKIVLSKLRDLGDEDDDDSGVVPLTVWNEGRSMPVACLSGQGVQDLRQEVEYLTSSSMLHFTMERDLRADFAEFGYR